MKALPRPAAARLLLPPLVSLLILGVCWQLLVTALHMKPYVLPSPVAVLQAIGSHPLELAAAAWLTGRAALCGFAICIVVGTLVGIVFAHAPLVRQGLFPYTVFLQTVPIIAIAPLIINWLGPGFGSIVLVSVIVGIFPVIANVTEGILGLDPALRELFRLNGASRWQTITKLELPHVTLSLLTGARTSSGLTVIGAIVGEFFAGNTTRAHGLGFLIPQRIAWLRTDEAFAAVLAAALLGVAMLGLVGAVRHGLLRRYCQH